MEKQIVNVSVISEELIAALWGGKDSKVGKKNANMERLVLWKLSIHFIVSQELYVYQEL